MPKSPSKRPRRKATHSPSKAARQEQVEQRRKEREAKRQQKEAEKCRKAEQRQEKAQRKEAWEKYVDEHQRSGSTIHPKYTRVSTLILMSFRDRFHELQTISKGRARKLTTPQLKPDELDTLPCEIRLIRPRGKTFDVQMKLYSLSEVLQLAKLRAQELGVELVWTADLKSRFNKVGLVIKHDYISIAPDDPAPNEIIWEGEDLWYFAVNVQDACLTYCAYTNHTLFKLEPQDVSDLVSKHGWLDLQSVAIRALEIHGGLKRHNQMIINKRKADQKAIEDKYYAVGYHDCQPLKPYSRDLEKMLNDWNEDSWMYDTGRPAPRPTKEQRQRTVLQYGPVWKQCMDDYGSDWMWFHGSGQLLEEVDLTL
ncbi:hypothetical protein VNI00_005974 [Paramarasmius palmivorus]|uniref:Uncharacterized protein n=1 Tax=Paramarasmius palmivorus TaxID=297713 RepID=A0AAW0DFY5_9AGAR